MSGGELPGGGPDDTTGGGKARAGEVVVRRAFDGGRNLLIAQGQFAAFLAGYRAHVARWELETDGLLDVMMRQGLAGLALHLTARPEDESVGLTVNIRHPAINLFLTGDATQSWVTGRAITEGVRTSESSRLYVQAQRPGHEPSTSILEIDGLDLLDILEQYYRKSEQAPARFYELPDDAFLGIFSLPGANLEWLERLGPDEAAALAAGELSPLGEKTFRFQCGCNPTKMLRVLRSLFRTQPEELFEGESGVETHCPRCGARWWIERAAFEAETDADE